MLSEVTGVEFDPKYVDRAIIDNIYGDGKLRKSAVDKILEAMSLMSGEKPKSETAQSDYNFFDHLEPKIHYQTDENYIRLHIAAAYPVFKKWAKAHDFEGELIPETTFKKQLQREMYFVENKAARIGDKPKNVFILDIEKMKQKGLEIEDEWNGTDEDECDGTAF